MQEGYQYGNVAEMGTSVLMAVFHAHLRLAGIAVPVLVGWHDLSVICPSQ
jgi:hypothetical protein